MLVYMRGCVANPRYVLKKDKVYDAPAWLVKILFDTKNHGIPNMAGDGSINRFEAAAVPYDPKVHGKRPVLKIPSQPDPEDRPDIEVEEDFEELV